MQLCACSFQDNLQLGFTCAFFRYRYSKRIFFRTLTSYGIDVELRCNDFYSEGSVKMQNCPKCKVSVVGNKNAVYVKSKLSGKSRF